MKSLGGNPAFHPAAGPVHRSLPYQDAGGKRHRTPEHLCPHHHHHSGRGYIEREQKALKPTILGEVTTKLMEEQFPNIVNVKFTANMEKSLDEVEEGKEDWVSTLSEFYDEFSATLEQAEKNMEGTRVKIPDEETDIICEKCGRPMVIRLGPVRQVPGLLRFPRVHQHPPSGGGHRRHLSQVRRTHRGEEVQERTQLLWL